VPESIRQKVVITNIEEPYYKGNSEI